MKKTLAIVLSVMMVLSLCTGMFSFAAEKGYAETEADKLWGEAVKATAITIQINGKLVDVKTAVTDAKIADLFKDVELVAEADKATTSVAMEGTISFDANGNLTLKGVKATKTVKATEEGKEDAVSDTFLIHANGGLKVVIEKGFTGSIRGLDHKNAAGEDVKVPAKSHLIVTSADHSTWTMPANGIGWDNGAVVLYGALRMAGDAGTGYDCMILRNNTKTDGTAPHKEKGWPMILAPEYATFVGGGNGPMVENRSGSIIICDNAYVTFTATDSKGGSTAGTALKITSAAVEGSDIVVRDNAVVVASAVAGKAIHNEAKGAITIQDKAFVSATGTNTASWGAVVMARKFNMNGGTLIIDAVANPTVVAATALNVQGTADEGSSINFNGGKVYISIAPGKDSVKNYRMHAIFGKTLAADGINFKGAEVYVKCANATPAADDANANQEEWEGAISVQVSGNINISGGKLTVDVDANSNAIRPDWQGAAFNVTGGDLVVNGGKAFISPGKADQKITVAAAANLKINSAAAFSNANSASATITGITLGEGACAVTQGTATAVNGKAPAVPAVPEIDVPETSDASVAAIAVVALISVAAAVVVLRKRVNG